MARGKLPVVAAIPNYNMGQSLTGLLRQVAEQEYSAVFILDDASTDDSREVVRQFDTSITFVAGAENLGAGANRNRIIDVLDHTAIVHFIDADMSLRADRITELAQTVASGEKTGFVGGLITESDGRQHPFNYGPRQCLQSNLSAKLQTYVCSLARTDPQRARRLRDRYRGLLRDWPDPQSEARPRRVFWTAEANFLIRSDVLAAIGGFDPSFRFHEIQDLAIRLFNHGFEQRFEPALAALHGAVLVRPGNRHFQATKAELQIARKYGMVNWLLPKGRSQAAL